MDGPHFIFADLHVLLSLVTHRGLAGVEVAADPGADRLEPP